MCVCVCVCIIIINIDISEYICILCDRFVCYRSVCPNQTYQVDP